MTYREAKGHREAQLRDELEEHWGEMDFALSADQMKHWIIILIEITLNIGISSQKPVDSMESKHSVRVPSNPAQKVLHATSKDWRS